MRKELNKKSVIVTGAAMGIGESTARAYAENGANVILADIDEEKGRELTDSINESGGNAIFVKCNVSNEDDVKNLVETAIEKFGRLDIACNNAGVEGEPQKPIVDCTIENWNKVIDINLKGVWLCMKYEIEAMLKTGGGSIVNLSSIAGLVGSAGLPAYVASKHGVNGLTKNAALEYAKQGIRVNSVCPAGIHTPMLERISADNEETWKQLNEMHPIGRVGTPEEVANAILWLSSDESSFTTGQCIAIDGGYTTQ